MVYATFWHIRHIGMDRKATTNLIGAVILSLSLMVDMFSFYDNGLQTDILGKIGIMLYLILLGSECMYEFNLQQEADRKAEIYKELAVTDTLTGLHNEQSKDIVMRIACEHATFGERDVTIYPFYSFVPFLNASIRESNSTLSFAHSNNSFCISVVKSISFLYLSWCSRLAQQSIAIVRS